MQKQSFLFSWDSKWPPCDKGLLLAKEAGWQPKILELCTRRLTFSICEREDEEWEKGGKCKGSKVLEVSPLLERIMQS